MHTFHLPSCWFCRNQQKLEVIVILGGVCVVCVCVCVRVCVVCVFVVLVCVCVCGVHVCLSKSWSHHTLPGSHTCLTEGCDQTQ